MSGFFFWEANAMEGKYPIILNGETVGELTAEPRGAMTEFRARCPDRGELVRLSVYGDGAEGYLGVMMPENGALTLCRRLSRAAMEGFPAEIRYAGASGEPLSPQSPTPAAEQSEEPPEQPTEALPEQSREPPAPQPHGEEEAPVTDDGGMYKLGSVTSLVWRREGKDALRTELENGWVLYAVPLDTPGLPSDRIWQIREIEGREYAVLRTADGKIL